LDDGFQTRTPSPGKHPAQAGGFSTRSELVEKVIIK